MRSKMKRDLMGVIGAIALYALLMGLIESEVIGAFWQLNIVLICINIILAVSLNLITGFTGQFSIGHAGFMAVGAYMSAVFTVKLGLPYIMGILAGAAGAAILGFAIGLPTLRLKGDYLAIATLGLGEIIRITILNIPYVGGASGLMGIPRYTTFTWAFFLMVITVLFIKNFINSSHGRACISIVKMRSLRKQWEWIPPNTRLSPSQSAQRLPAWPVACSRIIFTSPTRRRLPS